MFHVESGLCYHLEISGSSTTPGCILLAACGHEPHIETPAALLSSVTSFVSDATRPLTEVSRFEVLAGSKCPFFRIGVQKADNTSALEGTAITIKDLSLRISRKKPYHCANRGLSLPQSASQVAEHR